MTDIEKQKKYRYYNILFRFFCIPEILIYSDKFRVPLNLLNFGDPINFYRWFNDSKMTNNYSLSNIRSFVRNMGNLQFSIKSLPQKYRIRINKHNYDYGPSIHLPFPIIASTKKTKNFTTLFDKLNINNRDKVVFDPAVVIKTFSIGVAVCSFSFISHGLLLAQDLEIIDNWFFNQLKEYKKSLIYSLFPENYANNIHSTIVPERNGILVSVCMDNNNNYQKPSLSNSWKKLITIRDYDLTIYHYQHRRYLIDLNRPYSRSFRYDVLWPMLWAFIFSNNYDILFRKAIHWLKSSELQKNQYKSLWMAVLYSYTPRWHMEGSSLKSPYLVDSFQSNIFTKLVKGLSYQRHYNNFLRDLIKQTKTFSPHAHYALYELKSNGFIDESVVKTFQRISNTISSAPIRNILALDDEEKAIVSILVDKYLEDFEKSLTEKLIRGADEYGWLSINQLGHELGYDSHKYIYPRLRRKVQELQGLRILTTRTGKHHSNAIDCRIEVNNDSIKIIINRKLSTIIGKYATL